MPRPDASAALEIALRAALGAAACALLAAGGSAGAATPEAPPAPEVELEIADDRPLRGEPVRLTVSAGGAPAAGAAVEAIYRPNSSTTYREALPPADSSGTLFWTPRDAGPVTLEVRLPAALETPPATSPPATSPAATSPAATSPPAASRTVAVRYPRFPASGLAIMLLAGALLLGGAVLGFVMLLTGPRAVVPAEEPPST